jgi:hypothetical protein
MNSNLEKTEDKAHNLAGVNWTPVDRKSKSTPAQRSTSRTSSKGDKKMPKSTSGKRLPTGLHEQDSDISKDHLKMKAVQPPGKPNGDILTMFTATGGAGPKTTPPYVPDPIQVTMLAHNTTKKAINWSISPKNRVMTSIATVNPTDRTTAEQKRMVQSTHGNTTKEHPIEKPMTATFHSVKPMTDC